MQRGRLFSPPVIRLFIQEIVAHVHRIRKIPPMPCTGVTSRPSHSLDFQDLTVATSFGWVWPLKPKRNEFQAIVNSGINHTDFGMNEPGYSTCTVYRDPNGGDKLISSFTKIGSFAYCFLYSYRLKTVSTVSICQYKT